MHASSINTSTVNIQSDASSAFLISDGSHQYLQVDSTGNGKLALDVAEIDLSGQATQMTVKADSTTALTVHDGTNALVTLDTDTANNKLSLRTGAIDVSTQASTLTVAAGNANALKISDSNGVDILKLDTSGTQVHLYPSSILFGTGTSGFSLGCPISPSPSAVTITGQASILGGTAGGELKLIGGAGAGTEFRTSQPCATAPPRSGWRGGASRPREEVQGGCLPRGG